MYQAASYSASRENNYRDIEKSIMALGQVLERLELRDEEQEKKWSTKMRKLSREMKK